MKPATAITTLKDKFQAFVHRNDILDFLDGPERKNGAKLKHLIDSGVDVDRQGKERSPVQKKILKGLKADGVDVDTKPRYTAVMLTVFSDNTDNLKILIEAHANLNIQGPQGRTALDMAERLGLEDCAELLRAAGAKRKAELASASASPSSSPSAPKPGR